MSGCGREAGLHPAVVVVAAAAANVQSAHKVANVTQAHPSRVTESRILSSSCRLVTVGRSMKLRGEEEM